MEFRRPAMKSHQETTLCGRFVNDASYIGYAHNPQVFICSDAQQEKNTHPNFFCLGFSQGGEKGKVTQKDEQQVFLGVQWSSCRVLRYGPWCWGMGLLKQNDLRTVTVQLINNTIPTIHDKIVQNRKDDKLWDLQPVGFCTQAAWWIEFKHITVRLRPKNTLDPWN